MAIGDKMILTLKSAMSGDLTNPFVNVFAYEQAVLAGSALDLAASFILDALGTITDIVSSATTFFEVDVINLDNSADFAISPIALTGDLGGDFLPKFNAVEFEYVRADRAVHSGRKSFSLVPRDQQVDGVATSGYLGTLNACAANLQANLVGAASAEYIPRIWRRAGSYGSPPTVFPDTFYPISAVQYRRISTQNTRKR